MGMSNTSGLYSAHRILLVLVVLWAPTVGAGDSYRWVDEQGDVHFTDAPPPESARGADPDTDQAKEEDPPVRADDAASAARAEQSRRDHILWQSYTSVADIKRTRDRRLEGVDGEIGLAEHRVKRLRQQIERYDRLLADLPRDNEHRAGMERQRLDARERLQRRRQELKEIRARRMRMEARFARDIERFRELAAERE